MEQSQFETLRGEITAGMEAVRDGLARIEKALRALEPNLDQMMNVQEAAEYLRVSEHTMQRLAQRGRVPAVHVTKGYRFYRRDLQALAPQTDEEIEP